MWQFFIKGGPVMIPLALCSITGLIIIIERLLYYKGHRMQDEREIEIFKLYLGQGKINEAKILISKCKPSVFTRMAELALKKSEMEANFWRASFETLGESELKGLQRGLGILDTIVTASPLLGLLGTVTGIIKCFTALSVSGGSQATQLSLGIAEALYTTAFGLTIAIPSLFCLNFFYGVAEKRVQSLNNLGRDLMAISTSRLGE